MTFDSNSVRLTDNSAQLLVVRQFLSRESCQDLIVGFQSLAATPPASAGMVRIKPNRTEVAGRLFRRASRETWERLSLLREYTLETMRQFYGFGRDCHIEFTLMTEMRAGDSHPLHADNERQHEDGRWTPNHTPWRAYTGMIYLNCGGADFEGGLLRFPVLGQQIVPEPGLLVGFMCGQQHRHEVTPVLKGRRYAISMWMTLSRLRWEHWH